MSLRQWIKPRFQDWVMGAMDDMRQVVEEGGFELETLTRFRGKGPAVFASMYRGVAKRA